MRENPREKDELRSQPKDFASMILETEKKLALIDHKIAVKDWEILKEKAKDNSSSA